MPLWCEQQDRFGHDSGNPIPPGFFTHVITILLHVLADEPANEVSIPRTIVAWKDIHLARSLMLLCLLCAIPRTLPPR